MGAKKIKTSIGSLFLLLSLIACDSKSNADEVYEADVRVCNNTNSSLVDKFWARQQCLKDAEISLNERIKERLKAKKESAARECLSKEIPDTEKKLALKIRELTAKTTLDESKVLFSNDFKELVNLEVSIPKDSISEKVVIGDIRTTCVSDFRYSINIRFSELGQIRWFSTWVKTPPLGYQNADYKGYIKSLSRDFDREKLEEQEEIKQRFEAIEEAKRRDERIKQDQLDRENQAKAMESARVAQASQAAEKAAFLDRLRRDITMTVKEVKCYHIMNRNKDDCSDYALTVSLTNRSNVTINNLGYSVYWTPSYNDCKPSTQNVANYDVKLIPNETREKTVGHSGMGSLPIGPTSTGMKICVFLTAASP